MKSLFHSSRRDLASGLTWRLLMFSAGVLWVLLLFSIARSAPVWAATAEVTVVHSQGSYPAGGVYPVLFRIRIAPQWNIHGTEDKGDGLIPTALRLPETSNIRFSDIRFPPPAKKTFPFAPDAVAVYSGEVLVRAKVHVKEAAPEGMRELTGHLFFQACSEKACLPPEKVPLAISLRITSPGETATLLNRELFEAAPSRGDPGAGGGGPALGAGLWLTLFGLFLGGLALNLTPCIYPLIPITVSYFGGRSGKGSGRNVVHGVLYILGLAFTNSLLGVVAGLSGGMLGAALQNPIVLMGVAALLVWFGLSFFGLWEFRMPSGLTRLAARNYSGYFGTFFMGLTLGIVAAPCLGPFILGLITTVGQKGDPLLGFLYFFTLSVGMGLPLSLLAVFSGALNRLPMSGEWMVWVRKALGWILMGMAGYMIRPLLPVGMGRTVVYAGLLIAAGIHLGWLERSKASFRLFPLIKKCVGVLLIVAAVGYAVISLRPGEGVAWQLYDEARIAESKGNRPVILDFYADWCGPCVAMERQVFTDPQILELSKRFATLRVDLTHRHAQQDKLLERYGVKGVPTIIFLNKNGEEERALRIETYTGKDEVLDRMRRALAD
ncbi:MAG: thioredoxin family protein [Deltaproteobacteria bacterium]|nr:thioredoxin family protein [Deltaproteobacteria bacterium]